MTPVAIGSLCSRGLIVLQSVLAVFDVVSGLIHGLAFILAQLLAGGGTAQAHEESAISPTPAISCTWARKNAAGVCSGSVQ